MTAIETRKWLVGYLKKDLPTLYGAFFCAIGVALASLLPAYLLKPFFDSTSNHNQLVTVSSLKQIKVVSLEVVAIYAVRWFFMYGQTVLFAEAGQRLALRLRDEIYTHLHGLSLSFFNRQRTGALMSTINNDVPLLQTTFAGLKDVATAPILLAGGLWIIFHVSVLLSLGALIVIPLMGWSIKQFTSKIRKITGDTQDKLSDVNTLMEETISGVRIIQSFGAEQYAIQRFRQENQLAKDLTMSGVRQFAKLKPTTDVIGAVGVAIALYLAGSLVVTRQLTMGDLVKFIFTLNQIAIGIGGIGTASVTWRQIQAATEHIQSNILGITSEVVESPTAIALPSIDGKVEFRNVYFGYKKNAIVLSNLNFTIYPGQVIAVVGPSGAGKSTLADLIPRFYDPVSGQILIDGIDVRDVTIQSLRHQIGIVPQETVLFGGTIRDNIIFGNPAATPEMVEAAAKAANAHDFIIDKSVLPDGYDTMVGERGKQLSGGQRQRIAIARALLKDPRILILDEATSSLDADSEILVQEALDQLMQHRTTLVIAHRFSTIVNAHKIMVLESGTIVDVGSHSELICRPSGLYSRLYEKQFHWDVMSGDADAGSPRRDVLQGGVFQHADRPCAVAGMESLQGAVAVDEEGDTDATKPGLTDVIS